MRMYLQSAALGAVTGTGMAIALAAFIVWRHRLAAWSK